MDWVVHYKYAYETLEALKTGNLENMRTTESFNRSKAPPVLSRRKITIPKFIGVYQTADMVCFTEEEHLFLEEITQRIEIEEEKFRNAASQINKVFGKEKEGEKINRNLIHIGYNPIYGTNQQNKGLREILAKNCERIPTTPYQDLPDFYDKNTAVLGFFIGELNAPQANQKELSEEAYTILDNQLKTFGLTREEYAFHQIFDKVNHGIWRITMESNPVLKELIAELFS